MGFYTFRRMVEGLSVVFLSFFFSKNFFFISLWYKHICFTASQLFSNMVCQNSIFENNTAILKTNLFCVLIILRNAQINVVLVSYSRVMETFEGGTYFITDVIGLLLEQDLNNITPPIILRLPLNTASSHRKCFDTNTISSL